MRAVALDEFLPEHDFNEAHSTFVAATSGEVLAAARAATAREVPLLVVAPGCERYKSGPTARW